MEHVTFTPLVMSATGGMGRGAITLYKGVASMISEKRNIGFAAEVCSGKSLVPNSCRPPFNPPRGKVGLVNAPPQNLAAQSDWLMWQLSHLSWNSLP